MKQYFGNYLGLCVGNNDPEKRGRVQIFIPHIMPALFKDWNEAGEDIRLLCVGDNIPDSLPGPIVQKLTKMLPWAEAASPILGTSSPGSLVNNSFNQSPIIGAVTAPGGGTINNAVGGGTNGNWGGSLEKLSQIIPVGSWNPSSQKRGRETTASGGTSDHYENNPDAYAVDLGLNSSFNGDSNRGTLTAIQIVNNVRSQRNEPPISSWDAYRGGKYEAVTPDGYRVQVIWQSQVGGNHNDHIHVGVKNELGQSRPTSIAQGQAPSLAPSSNGFETTSTSGSLAAGNPFGSPMPLDLGQGPTFAQPAIESLSIDSQASIAQGIDGLNENMSPVFRDQYTRIYQALGNSKFANGTPKPADGNAYGINTGSREEWANFFTRLASVESSFNPSKASDIRGGNSGPLTSFGLYQLGINRFNSNENWRNINDNTNAFVRYAEDLYFGTTYGNRNVIAAPGPTPEGYYGLAAGFGPLRRTLSGDQNQNESQLLAQNIAASERQVGNYTGGMVTHTDPGGVTSTLNINNMAKGVFTYPAAGALLWVFFREGDPLFPVYFAASFGQREWQSAFRQGSDAPGYKPTSTADNPIVSTGTVANFGVGGWRVEDTTDPNNPSNNQKSFMIYGHDGSNMFFNDGYHQLFTKFNRRDQVEGDRFQSTLGVKQDLVQSDSNTIVMGDQVVKVGNVTPDAVGAMDRIHSIIKDIMKPITQSNGPQVPKLPAATNKYLKKALEESFAKYGRPDTTPYSIPAKVALEGEQAVPSVEPITQVPITPPTPPSR
jgi:hypothetical protein